MTDVFRYVIENVWFQRHVHVHRPYNPAELALPDVEDAVHAADDIPCYLSFSFISLRRWTVEGRQCKAYLFSVPCLCRKLFDGRLQFRQP